MTLAREGIPFVAISTVILVALGLVAWESGGYWWIPLAVWAPIAVWVPAFFRDPRRDGERGDHLIIAPADGVVVSVADADPGEFLEGETRRIAIFMNVFNVHVNRHPVSGEVTYRNYRPGKFFNASLDKASIHNEQSSLGVVTARGKVLVRQIAGLVARRIVTDPSPGAAAVQGERLGLIRFGSRVDTFISGDCEITVRTGEKTKAGTTVIGVWR